MICKNIKFTSFDLIYIDFFTFSSARKVKMNTHNLGIIYNFKNTNYSIFLFDNKDIILILGHELVCHSTAAFNALLNAFEQDHNAEHKSMRDYILNLIITPAEMTSEGVSTHHHHRCFGWMHQSKWCWWRVGDYLLIFSNDTTQVLHHQLSQTTDSRCFLSGRYFQILEIYSSWNRERHCECWRHNICKRWIDRHHRCWMVYASVHIWKLLW